MFEQRREESRNEKKSEKLMQQSAVCLLKAVRLTTYICLRKAEHVFL